MAIISLNVVASTKANTMLPKGAPTTLPIIILFSKTVSISCLTLQIREQEITRDSTIFICIASCGEKSNNKKGVAIIEKPNPVLVCKMEAVSIIKKYKSNSCKTTPHII